LSQVEVDLLTQEVRAAQRQQPDASLGPEAFVVLRLLQREGNAQAERAADAMETGASAWSTFQERPM